MRSAVYKLAMLAILAMATAAPAPEPQPDPAPAPVDDSKPEIIEIIAPAANAQETLATLNLGAPGSELSERNKRTIGILRQLFPGLTQMIEKKVQELTGVILRALGPTFLRAFLGGNRNNNGGGGGGAGNSGTVELDDDDDDDDEATTPNSSSRRRRALYFLPNVAADENQLLSGAESQQAEVRVAFGENEQANQSDQANQVASNDQQTAAQTNSATIDEISLDDADDTEENRNKRFLGFGGGSAGGSSSGGSGNFLFDVVRLVAGSSSGSSGAAPAEGDDGATKGDNLTEGVPGPVTRLFIIANRGIANLIQDLILRIAQTSERIVNFKARLITSII